MRCARAANKLPRSLGIQGWIYNILVLYYINTLKNYYSFIMHDFFIGYALKSLLDYFFYYYVKSVRLGFKDLKKLELILKKKNRNTEPNRNSLQFS